jgi:predicted PurR-regulated permease PerM
MKAKSLIDSSTKFFITTIGIIVIGIVLKELSHIFIPLVIAIFLFFAFAPLNNILEKFKIPLFLITIIDIVITFAFLYGVGKVVFDSFMQFSEGLPFYDEKLSQMIRNIAVSWGIKDTFFTNFSFEQLLSKLDYSSIAGGFFSSTFSILGSILFVLFYFVFVISGERTIYQAIKNRYVYKKVKPELKKIKKYLSSSSAAADEQANTDELLLERQKREERLENTFRIITEQIQRYILTKLGVNLAAGILTSLALYIIGIDYPIVWGLFVFLFNFIPTIGSAAALVLPVLFSIVQFDSFGLVLLVILIMAGIQTLAFNVAEPMIVGKSLNLNPLLILLSVLVWGYIWGIVGMLLSVPLTAIIKIIISNSSSQNLHFIEQLMSQEKV